MKKVLFLTSHLNSGSSVYFDILNTNYRVQGHHSPYPYTSPESYRFLTSHPHKLRNTAAVWMDELLYNHQFQWEGFYDGCKFIYVIREAEPTLCGLVEKFNFKPLNALRYYTYRLRRMCEMGKRTPGAIVLTWEDITTGRSNNLVEDYLNLKTPLQVQPEAFEKFYDYSLQSVSHEIRDMGNKSYEKHLYFLKNQSLKFWE